ncbi:putative tRNA pseudouridine synthase B [Candidatus Gugararchaeum adminiculabundum]|nr:putative tRNA pseudouridine synthase B [Candidatus Gugararchaeum adminiculabundum]
MKIRKEFTTNPAFGTQPEKRSIEQLLRSGIVLINKPCGPSSHEVSAFVAKILGIEKSGHTGTLDPQVSGVLPVMLGSATKISRFITAKDKEYVGIMKLHKDISTEKILAGMKSFVGEITQLPPLKSAVARRFRQRKIYDFKFIEKNGPQVLFSCRCEAGTYIRTLCADLGKKLGTGAHMIELRRTAVGRLSEKDCFTLQELSDAFWLHKHKGEEGEIRKILRPVESLIDLKKVVIDDLAAGAVCAGAQLAVPGVVATDENINKGELINILTLKNELVSISQAEMSTEQMLSEERGIVARTVRVVMPRGVYPEKRPTADS